jgi:PTS system mannose-specific IIA component
MIGILLVTHGRLGEEFVKVAEHVLGGAQKQVKAISIEPDDDMEKRRVDIENAIKDNNSGEGVIILTDMFGGTPSNLSISCLGKGSLEVVAGANLPTLIKLLKSRDEGLTLDKLAEAAQEAGRKYIMVASKILEAS